MSGGSFGFTIGKREQTDQFDAKDITQSQSRSLVGSTEGSLAITAGAKAQVSGSDLVAAQDLAITGRSVTIDPGLDQSQASESHDVKQSGLTVAVSSPVIRRPRA